MIFFFAPSIQRTKQALSSGGFSLIELLVVMAITMIIMSIVLGGYNRYRSATVLTNLAYSIALGVREAQVYGLSFKSNTSAISYGIHFSSLASSNTSFFVFADTAGRNSIYTVADTIVDRSQIGRGYSISSLCGYAAVGSPCTSLQSVDISFTRPDPDAVITGFTGSPAYCGQTQCPYSYVEITASTPALAASRMVQVWNSGQISVKP